LISDWRDFLLKQVDGFSAFFGMILGVKSGKAVLTAENVFPKVMV
jgi:hypothetical protein